MTLLIRSWFMLAADLMDDALAEAFAELRGRTVDVDAITDLDAAEVRICGGGCGILPVCFPECVSDVCCALFCWCS